MHENPDSVIISIPRHQIIILIVANLSSRLSRYIFAHAVIDEWFEDTVKRHCRREVALFRYADDVVICCELEHDADRVLKALRQRLERFGLCLNDKKTRMVSFARPLAGRNGGTSFDFLGFTFYWGRSLNGHPIPKVRTSGKRLRASLTRVGEWEDCSDFCVNSLIYTERGLRNGREI